MDFTTRNVIFRAKKLQTQKIHLTMPKAFKIFMEDCGIRETFFSADFVSLGHLKRVLQQTFLRAPTMKRRVLLLF